MANKKNARKPRNRVAKKGNTSSSKCKAPVVCPPCPPTPDQVAAFEALKLAEDYSIQVENATMRDSPKRLKPGDKVLFQFGPSGPYKYGTVSETENNGDDDHHVKISCDVDPNYECDMDMCSPYIRVLLPHRRMMDGLA